MAALDPDHIARLAARLESALRASEDPGAPRVLEALSDLLSRAHLRRVDQPVERVPGGREVLDSDLLSDRRFTECWGAFCAAVEAGASEGTEPGASEPRAAGPDSAEPRGRP